MPHQSRLRRGRVSVIGQVYHVTICTSARVPLFRNVGLGRLVVAEMRAMDALNLTETLAWVLMPDHLHWLFVLKAGTLPYLMNRFKSKTSRVINLRQQRFGSVWQRSYHDHALRNDEDVHTVARYIVANPLRAGLVSSVRNYALWDAVWV